VCTGLGAGSIRLLSALNPIVSVVWYGSFADNSGAICDVPVKSPVGVEKVRFHSHRGPGQKPHPQQLWRV
jgi:hypothetical protein